MFAVTQNNIMKFSINIDLENIWDTRWSRQPLLRAYEAISDRVGRISHNKHSLTFSTQAKANQNGYNNV